MSIATCGLNWGIIAYHISQDPSRCVNEKDVELNQQSDTRVLFDDLLRNELQVDIFIQRFWHCPPANFAILLPASVY